VSSLLYLINACLSVHAPGMRYGKVIHHAASDIRMRGSRFAAADVEVDVPRPSCPACEARGKT